MKAFCPKIEFTQCLLKLLLPFMLLSLTACGGSGGDGGGSTNNNGPWLGNWLLVNFLSDDDNGVWDQDRSSGIGMSAEITESEWKEMDDGGCEVTFSYSVDSNNHITKKATRITSECGNVPLSAFDESGRLEFSNNNSIMDDHFDVQPEDTLLAFRWLRQ